jgi:hypothetical protein
MASKSFKKTPWRNTPARRQSLVKARTHLTHDLIPLGKRAYARGERVR